MRYLILSDMHAGHRSSTIGDALPLLANSVPQFDQVIVNGDALQRWEKENPTPEMTQWRDRLVETLTTHDNPPIFITGNHDPAISSHDWYYLEDCQTLVFHGDSAHTCSSPWRSSETTLKGRVQKAWNDEGGPDMDFETRCSLFRREQLDFMQPWPLDECEHNSPWVYLIRNLFPPKKPWTIVRYRVRAPQMVADMAKTFKKPIKQVVFGHSHKQGYWEKDGLKIWNTGSYMPFSAPFGMIVEKDGGKLVPIQQLPNGA